VYEFETLICSKIWASQAKNSQAKLVITSARIGTVILKVDNASCTFDLGTDFKKAFFPTLRHFCENRFSLSENLKNGPVDECFFCY
jgi:hypothetical protein